MPVTAMEDPYSTEQSINWEYFEFTLAETLNYSTCWKMTYDE